MPAASESEHAREGREHVQFYEIQGMWIVSSPLCLGLLRWRAGGKLPAVAESRASGDGVSSLTRNSLLSRSRNASKSQLGRLLVQISTSPPRRLHRWPIVLISGSAQEREPHTDKAPLSSPKKVQEQGQYRLRILYHAAHFDRYNPMRGQYQTNLRGSPVPRPARTNLALRRGAKH